MQQHPIDATESGKPIMFHYHDENYSPADHHEAASAHDRHRNQYALWASRAESQGLKGSANGYRKLAAHHAKQSQLHFEKVLPAKTKATTKL
jgi:hypothetical protein